MFLIKSVDQLVFDKPCCCDCHRQTRVRACARAPMDQVRPRLYCRDWMELSGGGNCWTPDEKRPKWIRSAPFDTFSLWFIWRTQTDKQLVWLCPPIPGDSVPTNTQNQQSLKESARPVGYVKTKVNFSYLRSWAATPLPSPPPALLAVFSDLTLPAPRRKNVTLWNREKLNYNNNVGFKLLSPGFPRPRSRVPPRQSFTALRRYKSRLLSVWLSRIHGL